MKLKKIFGILLSSIFLITSCQEEKDEVIDFPMDQVFESNSTLAQYIQQISTMDGSFDNIIDKASCLSITLPITVTANGTQVEILTEDDFSKLEKIFDDSPDDNDTIVFQFPIEVILSNHSAVVVNNLDEFDELKNLCQSDDNIECIDLKYPVVIAVFDQDRGITEKHTLNNDKELLDFLKSIDGTDLLSFEFPITLILLDGSEITVNNNDEMKDMIDLVKDTCDEDDDNDFNDDDADDSELLATIREGKWVVSFFFDKSDETTNFNGYTFSFFEGDSVYAVINANVTKGTWMTNGDDGTLELLLDFGLAPPLDDLEDDWEVIEITSDVIQLKNISGGDGSTEFLTFSRSSDPGNESISNLLQQNSWVVSSLMDKGEDKTTLFDGYVFDFTAPDLVVATSTSATVSGTWAITIDGADSDLNLNFSGTIPFDELEEDWTVEVAVSSLVELSRVSGNGEVSTLKLVPN